MYEEARGMDDDDVIAKAFTENWILMTKGRIVPFNPSPETRLLALIQAGVVAWSGRTLGPLTPLAQTRGERAVAELLLEYRE